jgi:hypothetical protein
MKTRFIDTKWGLRLFIWLWAVPIGIGSFGVVLILAWQASRLEWQSSVVPDHPDEQQMCFRIR